MNALMGKNCRAIVYGFEGICLSYIEFLYGCREYGLQGKAEDNKRRERIDYFFEKQLEIIDEGISGKVEIPEETAPVLFGKECRDRVTGEKGICVGRGVFVFNSTQYIIEIPSRDPDKSSRREYYDEGRLEVVENSPKEITPESVQGPRPGGVLRDEDYPEELKLQLPSLQR